MKYSILSFLFTLFCVNVFAQVHHDTTIKEDNGFSWTITEWFDGKDFKRGAKTLEGDQLIPCEYNWIYYHDRYFYAVKEKSDSSIKALFSEDGKCIIPIEKKANDIAVMQQNGIKPYVLIQKDNRYGVYSLSGKEIVEAKYDNIFMHDDKYYTKNKNGDVSMIVVGNEKKGNNEDALFYKYVASLLLSDKSFYDKEYNTGRAEESKKKGEHESVSANSPSKGNKTNSTSGISSGGGKYTPIPNYGNGYSMGAPLNVPVGNGSSYVGGYNATGYSRSSGGYSSSGGSLCHLCAGSGQCKTCMGRGYYYSSFGSGKLSCPNCDMNHNGRCSSCHGTGKR